MILFFRYINSRSQESARQTEYTNRWLALTNDTKSKIKQDALLTLGSPQQKAGTFASQVVAAIAAVELPQNQWPNLIEILLGFINNLGNANLRISTLQTIGFICETIVCVALASLTKSINNLNVETRYLEPAIERDSHRCHPWCSQGGAIA